MAKTNGNGNGNGRNGDGLNGNGSNRRLNAGARARRKRLERARRSRTTRRLALLVLLLLLVAGIAVGTTVAFTGVDAFRNSCTLDSLDEVVIGRTSFVYDANGRLLGAIPAENNREPLAYDEISPLLIRATV